MSNIVIDGTGGGAFADQPGADQIDFGSVSATLTASQGQDTILAGGGSLLVDSAGNSNAVSITGGSGALVYSGGLGSATISAGTGMLSVLPSNGVITLLAGGGPIDIFSADAWSGYVALNPAASDTLTVTFNGATGEVSVFDKAAMTDLVIGQGFFDYRVGTVDGAYASLTNSPVVIAGLTPASHTGGSGDPLTTTDAAPVIVGTAPPHSTITITANDGTILGAPVTTDAQGRWMVALPSLPLGATAFSATASSYAGGFPIGGVAPVSATLQIVAVAPEPAPSVTGFTDLAGVQTAPGVTTDRRPQINGTAPPGSLVQVFANGTMLGQAMVTNTSWTYTPTSDLPEGDLRITAVATDVTARTVSAASASFVLHVALAAPTVDGFTDAGGFRPGGSTLDHTPALGGSGPDGARIALYDGAKLLGTANVAGGTWSITPSGGLLDGAHVVTAIATDVATGAVSAVSAPLAFTVDPAAPVAAALAGSAGTYAAGQTITDNALVLSGATDPGTVVTIRDGALSLGAAVVSGASWTFALPALAFGPHSLAALATDPSDGVTSALSASFSFVLAPPAPSIAGLTPATDTGASSTDGITSDTQPVIVGRAAPGDTVAVFDAGLKLGATSADATGAWQFTPSAPFSYGAHALTAIDTAPDGVTTSAPSAAVPIIIVFPSPTILSLDASGDGGPLGKWSTADLRPTLTGAAAAGSMVDVYDGASLAGQGTAAADGTWSVRLAGSLGTGLHILTATAADAKGDVSAPSGTLSLVENPPPSSDSGADPFAAAILTSIATLVGTSAGGDNAVIYPPPGQTTVSGAPAAVAGLSVDDSMAGQDVHVPNSTLFVSNIARNPVTIFGSGGGKQIAVSTGGDLVYVARPGSAVVLADHSVGNNVVFGSSSTTSVLVAATGAGNDIFVSRTGDASLSGGGGANQFWLGAGAAAIDSDGVDTIVAGSGDVTITGGANAISAVDGHSDLVFGGAGKLTFANHVGNSTVSGGSGSATLLGGHGSALLFGGKAGGNYLVAGQGSSTLFGGGGGDVLFAKGSGGDVLVAGGDNATLYGGSSSGNDLYVGGAGRNVIAAGSGSDTVAGCAGQSTVFAGAGSDLIFGADGGGAVVAGTGNATLVGGRGGELYAVFSGRAGGDVLIDHFRPGTDHLTLPGFSAQSIAAAFAAQTDHAGSALVVLADGTRITFAGLSHLSQSVVV